MSPFRRVWSFTTTFALVLFLWGFKSSELRAQLSPGPLSTAHRSFDGPAQCATCHTFGAGEPVFKCSECHAEIRTRVEAGRGYHARIADLSKRGRDCVECHREHVGRDFQLVHWPKGRNSFDHREAGFPLLGKHASQACQSCHNYEKINFNELRTFQVKDPSRTLLGLSARCASCHKDIHLGQFDGDCSVCHGADTWKGAGRFDHGSSGFPLTGRHAQVTCAQCHPTTSGAFAHVRYKGLDFGSCEDCHKDPHDGAFRQECASCHSTDGWKAKNVSDNFDHSKTGFPLAGKHSGLGCSECHSGIEFSKPIAHQYCRDCHTEDPHRGQFKASTERGDCGACHNEKGFIPTTFSKPDHEATAYPLSGKHLDLKCEQCHEPAGRDTLYKLKFGSCVDCHQDAHEKQFASEPFENRCEQCHVVEGFHPSTYTLSDHRQSRFLLAGSHIATACSQCHQDTPQATSFEHGKFRFASLDCPVCHENPHAGQFEHEAQFNCRTCHSEDTWTRLLSFDHSKTKFPLAGRHAAVGCAGCHAGSAPAKIQGVVFSSASTECSGCHEDVHAGQFNQAERPFLCSKCHTSENWRPTEFDHDSYSTFSLDGSHEQVPCRDCHQQRRPVDGQAVTVYRGTPRVCARCHTD